MTKRDDLRSALRPLSPEEVLNYLDTHSGLPGPRGNLELLEAFADVAPDGLITTAAASSDVFRRCAGVVGLGRLALEPAERPNALVLLRERATDASWRVREAVAMAVQRIGDGDPALARDVVESWLDACDALTLRAACAGICEPRLLAVPATAALALDACERATDWLTGLAPSRRKDEDVRTLRKGLGYCWSVAVAGSPEAGLARFEALRVRAEQSGDADAAWIVRENLRKNRLRRLIAG